MPAVRLLRGAGLAFGAGCNPVEGLVERGVERELREAIGPADRYAANVPEPPC